MKTMILSCSNYEQRVRKLFIESVKKLNYYLHPKKKEGRIYDIVSLSLTSKKLSPLCIIALMSSKVFFALVKFESTSNL